MMVQRKSLLSNIDPRATIIWILSCLLAGLLFSDIPSLAAVLLSIVLVGGLTRSLLPALSEMKVLWFAILVIALILGFTLPGEPILTIVPGLLVYTYEGFLLGMISFLRIFIFVLPLMMFLISVDSNKIVQAMLYFKVPYQYALMFTLALNFVPLLAEELARIMDAQRARAHTLADKGLIGKARAMIPLIVPLTLNALERADTIGKVLEMRGYAGGTGWSDFDRLDRGSIALLGLSAFLIVVAIISVLQGESIISMLMRTVF